jgi:6-pyruvoyltetrahydropterin/6-carboxytetrahydropterin synthase
MSKFQSTKTYDHNLGFSCAFRQWRADSHCNFVHGYPLSFKFVFGANELDGRNWVVNFGGLKEIKKWLEYMFDHTTCVAADDPELETFKMLHEKKLIDLRIIENGVGCERTAELVGEYVNDFIKRESNGRCWVDSCEVREHSANSAVYYP